MAKLKFYRGLESVYNATTHADGIYFATDTKKIFLNGSQYGGSANKTVANVEPKEGDASKIVITFTDDSTVEVPVGKVAYTSAITDKDLATPSKVGGIEAGTKVSALEGKTYDEMFDELLFPTVNPTFTSPSASLSLASGSALREVGSAAPAASGFNKTFNKGQITLNGTKQADRAGELTSDVLYYGASEDNTTLPTTVALGLTSYYYKVNYAAGPQPKNNKGGNYSSPLAAGSVVSSALVIKGTYPWYHNASGTMAKQALIEWKSTAGQMSTPSFSFTEMKTGVNAFKLPRKMTGLTKLNTVSGKYETVSMDTWTETTVAENIGGTDVTYYVYTYNGSPAGASTFIVKF